MFPRSGILQTNDLPHTVDTSTSAGRILTKMKGNEMTPENDFEFAATTDIDVVVTEEQTSADGQYSISISS
jgi:hypothetical protein